MKRAAVVVGLAAGLAICAPARSDAAVIGVFEWSQSCAASDPVVTDCFGVTNLSDLSDAPVDFTGILISLYANVGDATPVATLTTGGIDGGAAGVIPIGGFAQTTDGFPPDPIRLATLTIGSVVFRLLDTDTGGEIAGLTLPGQIAAIDRQAETTPIPEPSTLMLIGTAAVIGAARRRRRAGERA